MTSRRALAAAALAAACAALLALAPGTGAAPNMRARWDTRVFAKIGDPGYPALSLIARDGTVYVGTFTNASGSDTGPSKVFAYDGGGKLLRTYVIQGQTPGSAHGVQVAAENRDGILYLLDQNPARVIALNPKTGAQTTYATFRDVQPCAPGTAPADCGDTTMDNPPEPDYAAWGVDGSLYVTDYQQGLIWRVGNGGGPAHVWFTDPRLDGSLFGPAGIVMRPDRHSLLLSTSAGGATSPDATTGELYKLGIGPNGEAGQLEKIWESGPKEAPDGFALAKSGRVYLALVGPKTNQLAVIAPDGHEIERFPKDMSGDNGSPIPFDEPSSVQFLGQRLIVTNDAYISGDASHFAVFDIWAGEDGEPVYIPDARVPSTPTVYRVTVKPHRVRARSRHTFRFHVTASGAAVPEALVTFAGRRVRTGPKGNAHVRLRFRKRGAHQVRVSVDGTDVAQATVKVRRRKKHHRRHHH